MVVRPATRKAGNGSSNPADAGKFLFAIRATINVTQRKTLRSKRQIVTARFVSDVEIAAGVAPFRTVWSDSVTSHSKLREQMRQLVSKCAINVRAGLAVNRNEIVIKEQGIQRN